MKYSHKRIDIAPQSSETQQTHRHILPVLALWKDGQRYNSVGIQMAWWKWTITIFFKTDNKSLESDQQSHMAHEND